MSDKLIKQLNSITRVNLCDPVMVSTDDWNTMLASVSEVLKELEQSQARVSDLEDAILGAIQAMPSGQAKDDLRDAYDADKLMARDNTDAV